MDWRVGGRAVRDYDFIEPFDDDDREDPLREEPSHRSRAEDELRVAERLYYEGEFRRAAEAYGRARRHDPALFDAWAGEAESYLRAGDVDEAAAAAKEAKDTYGQVPVFYAALAIVLAHQGRLEEAYRHSDVSVQHEEASAFTWLSRAEVLLANDAPGIMRSVEACFEKAARHDSTGWQSAFRAALILLQWGKVDRALERLEHVVAAVPENGCAWKLQGDCHRRRGSIESARACYQMALARRPDYQAAHEALALTTFWGRVRKKLRGWLGRTTRPS
jgi:tetratricopeptide (TPR) repeat protein